MFAQRLDFLMRLTNTKSSSLGRFLYLDISTISRLRSGKRELPKGQDFIKAMSLYFAGKIKEDHQRKGAAAVICPGKEWPLEPAQAAELIHDFLMGDTKPAKEI